MPKPIALFATVTLALAGANVINIWALLSSFLFTEQLPTSTLFTVAFWLWIVSASVATWCGLNGGYSLLRNGEVRNPALTAFVVMSCIVFKVSGQEFGYSTLRLAVNIGTPEVRVGVNFLGFLFVWWLITLRSKAERPVRPNEADTSRGRGTI